MCRPAALFVLALTIGNFLYAAVLTQEWLTALDRSVVQAIAVFLFVFMVLRTPAR